ncbi:MAG: hemerythrin domain-containing protein, partial [Pseudonocardiaceae bacterium]
MTDITRLILDDHDTFRREFAALDDTDEPEQLREIWEPLTALLEVHTAAEEAILYPTLLCHADDGQDETANAIDALPNFQRNTPLIVRVNLAHQFLNFKTDHSDARHRDTSAKNPQAYVRAVQTQISVDNG